MCFIARTGKKRTWSLKALSPSFQVFHCCQDNIKKPEDEWMVIQTHKVLAVPSGDINTSQKTYFRSYWEVCHVLIKPLLYSLRKLQLPSSLKLQNCCSKSAEAFKRKLYLWMKKEAIKEETVPKG